MDSKFNTSFIPKKSLQVDPGGSSDDKYVSRRTVHYGPGFFLAFLLFVASVVGSAVVFGYTTIVNKRIDGHKETLNEQQNRFDPAVVEELIRTENRIDNAKKLVMNHTVLTQLFSKLEAVTLRQVQYKELTYNDAAGSRPSMKLVGITSDFKEAAQQTTVFRDDDLLHNPIMVQLDKNTVNKDQVEVSFMIETSVDEKLVSFSAALADSRFGKNVFMSRSLPVSTPSVTDTSIIESPLEADTNPM